MDPNNAFPPNGFAITPSNTRPVNATNGLVITGAGNLYVTLANNTTPIGPIPVTAGQWVSLNVKLVNENTTATGIIGFRNTGNGL